MSDAKTDYTDAVDSTKGEADHDSAIAEMVQQGYSRKSKYGQGWEVVDINDVVSAIAPGAKPVIKGGKIIYYNKDKTRAVIADVSGYLRVEDLTRKTKRRQYLDRYGMDAHNVITENGTKRGRTKDEFLQATHYIIRKRKAD